MKLYKRLFTSEEIKNTFGYDLLDIVNIGGFKTKQDAVDSWCDEAASSLNNLIIKNRGIMFAKNIYNIDNEEILNVLKQAQMYEMLFIIENGNIQASAKLDNSLKLHSIEAVDLLYSVGILINGF